MLFHTIGHGRRSVGDGGGMRPPTFQLGGDHIGNVPPIFCKSGKSHVFLSSSNLPFASPPPIPHQSTPIMHDELL